MWVKAGIVVDVSKRLDTGTLMKELEEHLREVDFFTVYASRRRLKRFLEISVSNPDKIRAILSDEYVQRDLFPDYKTWVNTTEDPVDHYLSVRISNK